ncbi:protein SUPPRESSOR OF QUENCHING 1, chloroplastic isoform X1 [Arachis duranensis]|uniref:Protein SUPPRESSOR OF QUENCHING 1, chloroplastic isoform X1 n=1 Tax=Arachis duranensis TaxID=130453 RepID=A0A6P5N445_ARADU|nr:protein SUPPRESSOR OF QUENCHING 1, chloroplastic isoform X1 [Arachis duranensis]XP_020991590.1 protein SUPPRESSOR OF QUENCHING 1, chloroplastic isoform X1 [Arachis duranensis]
MEQKEGSERKSCCPEFLDLLLYKLYACHKKDLDDFVEAALMFYGKRNLLDNTPITLNLEKDNDPRLSASPLKFPGKLAIDILNNRLFISDSNHNRIVVTDLDGNFIVQIGSSWEQGLQDGSFDDATFNKLVTVLEI